MSLEGIIPWGWAPDWGSGIREWLEWLTDTLPAHGGEEQRRSLRLGPRQQFEFRVLAQGSDRAWLESVLWRHGNGRFAVPLWPDALTLEAALPSGSTVVPVDPQGRQFAAGEPVALLGDSPRQIELAEVASVAGGVVTLAGATAQAWPAGTQVIPAPVARLDVPAALPRFTGQVASVRLRFEMDRPAAWPEEIGAAAYRGYPVLEEAIDWAEDPLVQLDRRSTTIDAGTGPVLVDDPVGAPLPLFRARRTLLSRSEIAAWRSQLFALDGRRGAIWVPSWSEDLLPAATIAAGSTTLDVHWCGVAANLAGDPMRRDLRIELIDGTVLYRRVTAVSELSASVERLTLDSALGVEVAPEGFALVSWLSLTRQESDVAEFAWWSGDVAQTTCSFRGFRHDV
ncbi:hypothetical protein [Arenimonas fontis]|uniref:Uncharacterized protein n=1 Tax=Arenimonas fontis TaxID=2608255 RepID=A0A5B2ZDW0_9GAMM|nr:hypothetical protein [Arenimonas fontis]KAA2285424.1 hypothetical protein F0415_05795 [Arenimonas fontis]